MPQLDAPERRAAPELGHESLERTEQHLDRRIGLAVARRTEAALPGTGAADPMARTRLAAGRQLVAIVRPFVVERDAPIVESEPFDVVLVEPSLAGLVVCS